MPAWNVSQKVTLTGMFSSSVAEIFPIPCKYSPKPQPEYNSHDDTRYLCNTQVEERLTPVGRFSTIASYCMKEPLHNKRPHPPQRKSTTPGYAQDKADPEWITRRGHEFLEAFSQCLLRPWCHFQQLNQVVLEPSVRPWFHCNECRPIMLPSVSTTKAIKPYSPIAIFSLKTFPP